MTPEVRRHLAADIEALSERARLLDCPEMQSCLLALAAATLSGQEKQMMYAVCREAERDLGRIDPARN